MPGNWDQSVFDRTLLEYLHRHESSVWPQLINKKAAQIAFKALEYTMKVEPERIERELARPISVENEQGASREVPIGFVIAAIRASKNWKGALRLRTAQALQSGKGFSAQKLWLSAIRQKFKSMVGGKKRSVGFLKVGWIAVLQDMAASGVRQARSKREEVKIRGALKGHTQIATPGKLTVRMENTAHAVHEKLGGFMRIGEPALKQAFDFATADMEKYLREELKPEAERFNRRQH